MKYLLDDWKIYHLSPLSKSKQRVKSNRDNSSRNIYPLEENIYVANQCLKEEESLCLQ